MSEKSTEEQRHEARMAEESADEIRRLRESLARSNRMHVAAERQLTEETARR